MTTSKRKRPSKFTLAMLDKAIELAKAHVPVCPVTEQKIHAKFMIGKRAFYLFPWYHEDGTPCRCKRKQVYRTGGGA